MATGLASGNAKFVLGSTSLRLIMGRELMATQVRFISAYLPKEIEEFATLRMLSFTLSCKVGLAV